tara:strand:- start:410 stop:727 length:318 start_codon:yes stop_codon:yes gene_type:complete
MGKFTQELDEIKLKQARVVAVIAIDLFNALIDATPEDTGNLKLSWELIPDGTNWIIFNPAQYATIALAPYVNEGGVHQGSLKFPAGIEPILESFNRELQRELNKI